MSRLALKVWLCLSIPLATATAGGFGLAWDGMNNYIALMLIAGAVIPLGWSLAVVLASGLADTQREAGPCDGPMHVFAPDSKDGDPCECGKATW